MLTSYSFVYPLDCTRVAPLFSSLFRYFEVSEEHQLRILQSQAGFLQGFRKDVLKENMMESLTKWDNWLAIVLAISLGYLSHRLLMKLSALCWSSRGAAELYSSLHGKHVVITGGSSGIGYSLAKYAVTEGATVTLIARNVDKLLQSKASLIHDLHCLPSAVHVLSADVSDPAAITAAIRDAQERMPIDVLVCNAGVMFSGKLGTVSTEHLEETVRINVLGSVFPIHAAIPLMKSRSTPTSPQSILLISSLASLYHCYGASVYTSTKYAQRGLAATLKWELLPYNIHVHVVCPGFVATPMFRENEENKAFREMNFVDPKLVAAPSHVAKCAWEGVKRGSFLITTDWVGHVVAVLSRGLVPDDSLATNVAELLLLVPVRLVSFVLKRTSTNRVLRLVNVPAPSET